MRDASNGTKASDERAQNECRMDREMPWKQSMNEDAMHEREQGCTPSRMTPNRFSFVERRVVQRSDVHLRCNRASWRRNAAT